MMILKLIQTGMVEGYSEYHGDILIDNKKIGSWDRDKNQDLLIATQNDKSPIKFKIYAKSIEGIKHQIIKKLRKMELSEKHLYDGANN